MFSISIQEAEFFAFHGFYPEEQKTGKEYKVSLKVEYNEVHYQADDLDSSVNYVVLYKLIKHRMYHRNYLLLEDLAKDILDDTFKKFPFISSANISLRKINPSVGGQVEASVVELGREVKSKK